METENSALEDIIRQLESQMQYDKDLALTKARQDVHAVNMKHSTQKTNEAEINDDCTVNTNKANTLEAYKVASM